MNLPKRHDGLLLADMVQNVPSGGSMLAAIWLNAGGDPLAQSSWRSEPQLDQYSWRFTSMARSELGTFLIRVPGVAMDGPIESTPRTEGRDIAIQKVGVVSADGQTITYTITVTGSNGDIPELTILCPLTITDTLPPGATLVSSSSPSWNGAPFWTSGGPNYVPNLCVGVGYFGLAPGDTVTFPMVFGPPLTIVVNVPPGQVVTNCASVSDGAGAPIPWWIAAESNLANNTSCTTNSTPAGSIFVKATLDGAPWTGPVSFTVAGPQTVTGSSVPLASTASLAIGTYALSYVSGGPPGATLLSTTPSATQTLTAGGGITYMLNFRTQPATLGSIFVKATLDGAPWTGPVSFTIAGPQTVTGSLVPLASTASLAIGTYALSYVSGGPAGATLLSTTPSATQTLTAGGGITYTLNFRTKPAAPGTIVVNATVTDAAGVHAWTGPVSFTLTGPQTLTGTAASQTFASAPVGAYTLAYISGGPPGKTLTAITPLATQPLASGGTSTFTLVFR